MSNVDILALLERHGKKMEFTALYAATGLTASELFVKLNALEALGKITVTAQPLNASAIVEIASPPPPKPEPPRKRR